MSEILNVSIPDLNVNDNQQNNVNFDVVDVSLGDTSNYQGAISQGEGPNALNKFVDWIRDDILHIPNNGKQLNLAEIIRLKSIEENKPESEIKQQIGEEFPSAIPQYYVHSALSSFFNTATAGIIPEEEKLTPETTTGKVAQALTTGTMDLAGFIAFSLLTGGVGDVSKITKSGNYVERIGNLVKSIPIASKLADAFPFANAVKSAAMQGLKFGGLTLADGLINMNEHTNNVWMAIKDLEPSALDNFLIGAGLPLAGKINSPFKRVLLALLIGNTASKITSGTTDINKLITGIRMADPEATTNAMFNLGVQAFFGLSSIEPRPEQEFKETQELLNDLYNNVKLQIENQKLENFNIYTEPKNIDISFDKLLKQQIDFNIGKISETEEIPPEKIKKVNETDTYTDEETENEIEEEEEQPQSDLDKIYTTELPKYLKGAKPKYGYKRNLFDVEFENDIDKAFYIVANRIKLSAHDKEYMDFLKVLFPQLNEDEIRSIGDKVKDQIKQKAKQNESSTIRIEAISKDIVSKLIENKTKDNEPEQPQEGPNKQPQEGPNKQLQTQQNVSLPDGWKIVVDKNRRNGYGWKAFIDYRNKEIVFENEKYLNDKDIVNHELSHLLVNNLDEKTLKDYVYNVMPVSKERLKKLGFEDEQDYRDFVFKNQYHYEELAIYLGKYLSGEKIPKNIKKFFEENIEKKEEQPNKIPETAGDKIDNPTYMYKEITADGSVYGVMKLDKLSKKIVMKPFKDFNDLRLWKMQGTKQTIGSLEQYHRLLKLGLKGVDNVYDAFMGSGFITNLLHNTKDLKDAIAGKKYYINEINKYRNTFAKMLYGGNRDELIKYIKKAYDDIVNRIDNVVKNNKGKSPEELAKLASKDLTVYLNDLFDPKNKKLTDKEKAGYYYFSQNASFMAKPIDNVEAGKKLFVFSYDDNRLPNLFNLERFVKDKEKTVNDKWKQIETKLKTIRIPEKANVYYGADTWVELDKLPKNSFVIWDSEYVEAGKGYVTEYKGNLLIKPVTSHTSVESYIEALDKLIPEINSKNVKIILHNNWRDDLADELSDRGFLISKTQRGLGKGAKNEILAYNFDVDGSRLEVGKGVDNTKYLFSAGLSPEMLKLAFEGTTKLGRKLMKLIADDVEGYRATVFHMLLTPEFSQYSKNPFIRETFKALQRDIFEAQKYVADLTADMKNKLETSALSLKSLDKETVAKINDALVKGDALKKDPLEIIDNYDLSAKELQTAREVIKNIKEFYKQAWDIKIKHYGELLNKLQNSKIKGYAKQVLESLYKVRKEYPYYIPRTRNVGNIKIDVYDTKTDKKVHSEIVLDYSPLFTGGKSIIAKVIADRLRKQYADEKYEITISSVKNFDIKKDSDLYGILDYLGEVLDNVDLTDQQKEQIFSELVTYLKSTGFTSHLIRRAKNVIKGYNEDVIGVTHSYFNAFKSSVLKSQIKEAFASALDLARQDNVVYKMVSSMFDEYMRNRDSLDKGIAMVKGFAFMKYLGFSMRQLIIQSTQTPIFTGMHLAVEEAKGRKANVIDWAKSETNLVKSAIEYLSGEYKNDPVKNKFINDLEKAGVLNAQQTAFYTGKTSLLSNTWNKFTSAAGYIMAITERFNRYVSALSYINTHYDRLKSSLKENYADELYNLRSFVYLTNGKYGDTELPLFLQGADTVKRVTRLGMIFQTFQIDMLQGMKKLMNEGQYTALLLGLGSMCFLGGLTALPFYNAIKSTYLNTTGRDMETDMIKFMGSDEFVDWLQSGLFGKVGIDISASLGLQTPLDMTPYMGNNVADQFATVVFGVSYASLKDTIKSIKYLGGGDLDKALYYGLPFRFLAYPIKAIDQYYRGITTSGDLLLVDPMTGKPLKLTLKEALLQSAGFTPQRISEFMNIYYNYKTLSQYYQNKRKSLYMKYRNAVERGNWKLAREILKQGLDLNKKVSIINADYGISLPLFNVRSINTISKQIDLMRFMHYNYR